MIIKPKFKWRDEFLTPRRIATVNSTAIEPGPGARTIVDTETALAIIPKVGSPLITHTGVTFGGSNNRCSYGPTSWMDFPTGFDAAAHAGLGRIVIMFDSAGVGCWAYLGAAGDETGETLGADLLAGWDFTSEWSLAGSATIVDSTHFNALSAPSGVYAAVIPILAVGVMYQGFIDGTTSAGSISLRQASGSGVFSSGLSITGYGISTVASTPYIKSSVASSVYISSMTIKQVLTPSETGVYAYKDAAMTTSGWNKPTSFNMNSASYTFGIYEPQSRGRLFFMGGKASPGQGDPGYWKSEAITRKRGLVCCWKVNGNNFLSGSAQISFGFDDNKAVNIAKEAMLFGSTVIRAVDSDTNGPYLLKLSDTTDTYLAIVLRDSGAHFYAKIGTANWKYLWSTTVNNTATLYAGISNYNAVGYYDWIRQSNYLWMPKPLISDSFAGADGSADGRVSNGLGHAETTGLGSGGSGVVWSGATGSIVSNRLVITPTLGEELNSGDIVVGNWYQITATQADFFYTGCAVGYTFRCTTAKTLSADNKVKLIDPATTRYVTTLSTKDAVFTAKFTMGTGLQVGIVFGLNDAGTYYGTLYHNGAGSVVCAINENGVWTVKSTTAIAYAESEMIIRRDDTAIWAYYGATPTLCGTGPTTTLSAGENTNLSGVKVGLFSTSPSNSFSSAVAQFAGTNGELEILTRLVGN